MFAQSTLDPLSHLSGPCKVALQADLITLPVDCPLSHKPLPCVSSVMLTFIFGGRSDSEELPLDRGEKRRPHTNEDGRGKLQAPSYSMLCSSVLCYSDGSIHACFSI